MGRDPATPVYTVVTSKGLQRGLWPVTLVNVRRSKGNAQIWGADGFWSDDTLCRPDVLSWKSYSGMRGAGNQWDLYSGPSPIETVGFADPPAARSLVLGV